MEFILIARDFNLEDIGEAILEKEMDNNMIMDNQFIKELIKMIKRMDQVNTFGRMEIDMKVNGKIIIFLEKEFILSLMEEYIKDNGRIT